MNGALSSGVWTRLAGSKSAAWLTVLFSPSFERATEAAIACSQLSIDKSTLAAGLDDGSFQVANLAFKYDLLSPKALPEGVSVSQESPVQTFEESVYEWFDATGVQRIRLEPVEWSEPVDIGDASLKSIDYLPGDSSNQLAQKSTATVLAVADGQLIVAEVVSHHQRLHR